MDIAKIRKSWKWRIVKAGITQQDMAKAAGVSQVTISNYINMKCNPSLDKFEIIENKLKDMGV